MPAGDLVVLNHQIEIRVTLLGRGTSVHIDSAHIGGLGNPPVKSADFELDGQDGSVGSPDYNGVRVLSIPIRIIDTSESAAMLTLKALNTAWRPSTVDIPLHFRLPGWNHFSVMGRPRGGEPNLAQVKYGTPTGLLRFDCLDPTITYY